MKMHFDERLDGLRDLLPKLEGRDREFAISLLHQAGSRGLSDKQQVWVDRLRERALNPGEDLRQNIGEKFGGIVELIDKAAAKLKWPRLLFRVDGRDYRLSLAGARSREPGSINVTDTEKSGPDRKWFGRVTREGVFEPARSLGKDEVAAIAAALKALAADPAGIAKMYGLETGVCCFCGLELTDKRSIAAGYGPVCADNYGLPWGGSLA